MFRLTVQFLLLALACFEVVFAQQFDLRGKVSDANNEPLIGATVMVKELQKGAYTNADGIFIIKDIPFGKYTLSVSSLGYNTREYPVDVSTGKIVTINPELTELETTTDEVVIEDEKLGEIQKDKITTGLVRITPKDIKLIPSLGTPDLAQYLQVLPGVVFTGDQGGQLFVRGGTPIQNMVLIDGAIIYSPFHSLGLFSVFDVDYLRTIDVYSAAFPSQYGGRVSSVMDIKSRNGNFNRLSGKVNLSPVASALLLEGPISKGKSSFLLSYKNSMLDKTSTSLYSYINDSVGLPYAFNDLYGKITLEGGGSFINLFGFNHQDRVNFGYPANFKWDSYGGGTNFMLLPGGANAIISGNLAYSSFKSGLQSESENFPRNSSIDGFNGGFQFTYLLNSTDEFNYGISILGFRTNYEFTNTFGLVTKQEFNNTEFALHARYKTVLQNKEGLKIGVIEPGLRVHYYNDHSYLSVEPRIRTKWNLNRVSLTLAAGAFAQNLLSATSDRDVVNLFQGFLAVPEELTGLGGKTSLQLSRHALAGIEFEIVEGLSSTIEGWYKLFPQVANVNRNRLFPTDPAYIQEKGKGYGLDLILKYENKDLYLYGVYGWAQSYRDNGSQVYPPVFDRRHNGNFVAAYKVGNFNFENEEGKTVKSKFDESRWEFSVRWNIGSGFPFTQTQGFFEKFQFTTNGSQTNYWNQNGSLGILYSDSLNAGRMPYYHRLDLSAKHRWVIKNKTLVEASVDIINAYNRHNVFYFDRVLYKTVYQLPLVPSVTLTAKF